jgi:hypothetical protein
VVPLFLSCQRVVAKNHDCLQDGPDKHPNAAVEGAGCKLIDHQMSLYFFVLSGSGALFQPPHLGHRCTVAFAVPHFAHFAMVAPYLRVRVLIISRAIRCAIWELVASGSLMAHPGVPMMAEAILLCENLTA